MSFKDFDLRRSSELLARYELVGYPFEPSARDDHSYYLNIMGLLLAANTYLFGIDSIRRKVWIRSLLGISMIFSLGGIFTVMIASTLNYAGKNYRPLKPRCFAGHRSTIELQSQHSQMAGAAGDGTSHSPPDDVITGTFYTPGPVDCSDAVTLEEFHVIFHLLILASSFITMIITVILVFDPFSKKPKGDTTAIVEPSPSPSPTSVSDPFAPINIAEPTLHVAANNALNINDERAPLIRQRENNARNVDAYQLSG